MPVSWEPSCDLQQLKLRADVLSAVRGFFREKKVLEVETPLLCHATGTDPQLDFFSSQMQLPPNNQALFLQTSPEFCMKRLLAAGSGSIFQICKAFRNGEAGRYHNPEFTILEWYRVNFTLQQLMDEVAELLTDLLSPYLELKVVQQISYQQIFLEKIGLDPLVFNQQAYQDYAEENDILEAISICTDNHALWLDFIFSHHVQVDLGRDSICLVHSYPAIQSSLARINPLNPRLADRFEVFVNGIELGNGFFELTDVQEQEMRFDNEIVYRQANNLPAVEKDPFFLAALKSGLPECSGVAIGLDRLLMILAGSQSIDDVLSFPISRA